MAWKGGYMAVTGYDSPQMEKPSIPKRQAKLRPSRTAAKGEGVVTVKHRTDEEADDGEDDRLRKQFACQADGQRVVPHAEPLAGGAPLDLRTNAEDGDDEDEQLQQAGHDGVAEVDGVVQPRVSNGVRIDGDGLNLTHDLRIGHAARLPLL